MPAILMLDTSGRVVVANGGARTLWQAAESELIGESFPNLFALDVVTDEQEWLEAQWEVLLGATLNKGAILSIQPKEGAPVQRHVTLEVALGTAPGYLAVFDPIADPSAEAPEGVRVPGLNLLTERGPAGFFDLNLKTGRFHSSSAWRRMLGYAENEIADTYDAWLALIHPEDTAAAPDQIGRKLTVGTRTFGAEFRMKHRLGHWVWIQCLGVQILAPDGGIERVAGINLDISERKELEEASVANDARLQDLSGAGPLGAFELDFAGGLFWFSPAWNKILGYTDRDAPTDGSFLQRALPADDQPAGVHAWLLARTGGIEMVKLQRRDGREVTVMLGLQKTLNRKKEIIRAVGFICLPPALLSQAAPVETSAIPATLSDEAFAAMSEAVIAADSRGKVLFCNPCAQRLMKRTADEIVGKPLSEVFRLADRESVMGIDPVDMALAATSPLPLQSEHALLGPGESDVPLPVVWTARISYGADAKARGVAIVFRDPQEMTLTPDELVKANRFESLGLLAGGIAHDFNNLLTTIMGGISIAKDNRDYSVLEDAEKACMTAKGLTKQLLAFAKGAAGLQTVVSPKELLADAIKIAGSGADVVVEMEVPDTIDPVLVDRGQMLQVFQNLIINSVQAMPAPPHRGRIQLRASRITLADGQIPSLHAGDYVEFQVRDNGSGIKPEHLERIWDPFFTTKKHGTGLGLATVLSIVRRHGGEIGLDSVLGTGTAFTVFLPKANRPVDVQARRSASLRFGTGRILFMDDDEKICQLSASMLQSLDYKYDIARNGEEAIALYKRYLNIGRPYDAVLMDLTVIGGMGGEETYRALKELDPDVRAIISSGYDNDDMARRYLDMGFCGYLTKPYRVADMGKVLKTVLG